MFFLSVDLKSYAYGEVDLANASLMNNDIPY